MGGTTIDQFYASRHCIVCDSFTPAREPICTWCQRSPQATAAVLQVRSPCLLVVLSPLQRCVWLIAVGQECPCCT